MPRSISWPLLACLAFLTACQHATPDPEGIGFLGRLGRFGRVEVLQGAVGRPTVLLVADRHNVAEVVGLAPPAIAALARQNHSVISYALDEGFQTLGTEAPYGDLPKSPGADAQREGLRRMLHGGRDPSDFSVYQPLRYEVEFGARLLVVGVEDPTLYGRDVDRLAEWHALGRRLVREEMDAADERVLIERRAYLVRSIRGQAAQRGRLAANGLLRQLAARGADRGILMIGGGHLDGALSELLAAGIEVIAFEGRAYLPESARP